MRFALWLVVASACGGNGGQQVDAHPPGDAVDAFAVPDARTDPYDPTPWGAACTKIPSSDTSCMGRDGTIGWCVEHGFWTVADGVATWTTTRPDSCELACTPPSDTCPGGLAPRYDKTSECYCSPTL